MQSSLSARLQTLRIAAGWSQVELSRLTGLSKSHICEVENGRARPSLQTLHKLAAAHQMSLEEMMKEVLFKPRRRGSSRLKRHSRALRHLFGRCQPNHVSCTLQQAFNKALQTHLGPELIAQVDAQRRSPVFWKALKHMADPLNSVEQTFVLHMMADGHDLEDLTPADVGIERSVVWDPRRRWLAIVAKISDGYLVIFPQLGMTTLPGRYRTLDFCVAVARSSDGNSECIDVEVDGPSHRGREEADARRDAEVRLLVIRIPLRDLDHRDFARRFIRSILSHMSPGGVRKRTDSNAA